MVRRIHKSVGKGGSNQPQDVVTVQELLNGVSPFDGGPQPRLVVDSRCGPKTTKAIQTFQLHHFGWSGADGRVDPDHQTIKKLNELASEFPGCSVGNTNIIKDDLKRARRMLDAAIRRLRGVSITVSPSTVVQDTKEKVRDIFKIDLLTPPDSGGPNVEHILNPMRFNFLLLDFNKLRAGFNRKFPIVCEPQGVLAAFVSNNFRDETVHVVTPRYFALNEDRRAVTLVHERAHTVLRAAGHPGTGDVPACIEPHKGFPGLTYDEAVKNAWCYEWLTASLQSNYTPGRFADLGGCHLAGHAS